MSDSTVKVWGRINTSKQNESFYRCNLQFTKTWDQYEVDPATFARLQAEQMIEVTDQEPADYTAPTPINNDDDKGPFVDGPTKPEDIDALNAAINGAVGQLEDGNQEHFTQSGAPKIEALQAILGYTVSAAERDAALAVADEGGDQ